MKRCLALVFMMTILFFSFTATAEEEFVSIEPFSNGLAAVQKANGFWGYIDQTGKLVIPCEWKDAGAFDEGIASVRKNHKYGCINSSGQLVVHCEWNGYAPISFSEGLGAVRNDAGLWGFIDKTGTVIIPCEWEDFFPPRFSEGLAAVEKNDRMGYINQAGELVIPCQYVDASPFSHGYAMVQDEQGLFFIDAKGEEAFPEIPRAIGADSFREDGIAFLHFDDFTGIFIDTDGRTVCTISSECRIRSNFREGLAGIATRNEEGKWVGCEGYIDRTGAFVIPNELYSSYRWFMNGRACIPNGPVTESSTRYGVIDHSGALVYPFTLDKVVEFTDTVTPAIQGGRTGAINTDGKVVIPFQYDDVKVGEGLILCLLEGNISLFDYDGTLFPGSHPDLD